MKAQTPLLFFPMLPPLFYDKRKRLAGRKIAHSRPLSARRTCRKHPPPTIRATEARQPPRPPNHPTTQLPGSNPNHLKQRPEIKWQQQQGHNHQDNHNARVDNGDVDESKPELNLCSVSNPLTGLLIFCLVWQLDGWFSVALQGLLLTDGSNPKSAWFQWDRRKGVFGVAFANQSDWIWCKANYLKNSIFGWVDNKYILEGIKGKGFKLNRGILSFSVH